MSSLCRDLLRGEETNVGLVFPFSEPVPAFERPDEPRRRRRTSQQRPVDWADVFEAREPVVVRGAPEALRLRAMAWDTSYLETHMPTVRVHTSQRQTVQMMSTVQPLGGAPPCGPAAATNHSVGR